MNARDVLLLWLAGSMAAAKLLEPRQPSPPDDEFEDLFRSDAPPGARAKFLSRVFGIFSEDVVRIWGRDARAPYEYLGRPTIGRSAASRGYTLDFTLREKGTGKIFVAEMKCEIEYRNFAYFVLNDAQQLTHHTKPAFAAFLACAGRRSSAVVNGQSMDVSGAILVWGAATPAGRTAVVEATGIETVLTVEDMCRDLVEWKNSDFQTLLAERERWTTELCRGLGAFQVGARE